jgi:hypothetical protein
VVQTKAAEPTVRNVSVRGLQVGGTTTITIDGDDLGKLPLPFMPLPKAPKLLLPFPAKQTLKPGYTANRVEFEVTLGEKVTPGLYHLRLVTEGGASLPVVIGVDRLSQMPFGPKIEKLPAAVHGTVTGSTVAETTFAGKANEKITVEVEAQRIGSKLRPVIHLYTAKKLQLAWAWGTPALDGDARLEATLPADGTYTISIHDAEYAGQSPGFFRLKVGQYDYVDQVFPPVAGTGTRTVQLIGSSSLQVALPAGKSETLLMPWPTAGNWTGPRPWVAVSSRPEFTEPAEPGKVMELPAGRCGVSGKLAVPHEEDRYKVAVKPNTKMRFEVFAERIGSPVDVALVIRNEAGGVLAQNEDSPGTLDPVLEYAVPDKVTSVTVSVVDSSGRGGPRAIYRLTVDPVKGEGAGDYELTTPSERLTLPAGGKAVVPVFVNRRGYAGKIDLNAENLPPGVKLEGTTIPPDADGTLVTVTAKAVAEPAVAEPAVTNWTGTGGNRTADVMLKGHPLERLQPWLATEMCVAPTDLKAADFVIEWRNLPADAGLSPGGKLALPVVVKRADPAAPVRLTLLTSQAPPLTNGQPDPNRALRPERPVELAAKVSDSELSLVIPAELPADSYQVAVQAELLSANKQKVLATAVTPVKAFPVRLPVAAKADRAKFTAKLDAKSPHAIQITGTARRLNGFTGDITVSLTGLPAGVPVPPPVTLKSLGGKKLALKLRLPFAGRATIRIEDQTRFAFGLNLPPTTPGGEVALRLSASVVPDPKQPGVRVKGRDVELLLNVIPPK